MYCGHRPVTQRSLVHHGHMMLCTWTKHFALSQSTQLKLGTGYAGSWPAMDGCPIQGELKTPILLA